MDHYHEFWHFETVSKNYLFLSPKTEKVATRSGKSKGKSWDDIVAMRGRSAGKVDRKLPGDKRNKDAQRRYTGTDGGEERRTGGDSFKSAEREKAGSPGQCGRSGMKRSRRRKRASE